MELTTEAESVWWRLAGFVSVTGMAMTSQHAHPERRQRARALAIVAAFITLVASVAARPAPARAEHATPRIIIDTDFGQWWDDVAALATAHAAADAGRVRLLGVMADVDNRWNAPAIDALNTWYGRPDLPVGVPAGAPEVPEGYSRLLAQQWPHAGRPVNADALYRRLLTAQPDHSVTIVAIGALTNLAELLRTDRELVARKVARTVVMGGEYPRASAPEWNFGLDRDATRQVVGGWPGPVVYDGFEVGARIFVGHNTVTADGINRWQPGGNRQRYLVLTDPAKLSGQIDALLNRRPRR